MPYWFAAELSDVKILLGAFDEFEGTTRASDDKFFQAFSQLKEVSPWGAYEIICRLRKESQSEGFKLKSATETELVIETSIQIDGNKNGWHANQITVRLYFRLESFTLEFTVLKFLQESRDFEVIRLLLRHLKQINLRDLDYDD